MIQNLGAVRSERSLTAAQRLVLAVFFIAAVLFCAAGIVSLRRYTVGEILKAS